MITQDKLKQLLHYNPETGDFTWLVSGAGKTKGEVLRSTTKSTAKAKPYYRVKIEGKTYQLHRLAWLYMTGNFPTEGVLDHINRNSLDNRWSNLRNTTVRQNAYNCDYVDKKNIAKLGTRYYIAYVSRYGVRKQKVFRQTEEGLALATLWVKEQKEAYLNSLAT